MGPLAYHVLVAGLVEGLVALEGGVAVLAEVLQQAGLPTSTSYSFAMGQVRCLAPLRRQSSD